MWFLCSKVRNHGKEAHLALESRFEIFLTDPSVPTTQRLDGKHKDNQRKQQLLVITNQEQKVLKKVFGNQFRKIVFALELTKERSLIL